jgi:hypothetical protein
LAFGLQSSIKSNAKSLNPGNARRYGQINEKNSLVSGTRNATTRLRSLFPCPKIMVGGFSAEKPADDEIRALFEVDSVRFSAADKLGQTVDSLVVISYQTQVVRKLLV